MEARELLAAHAGRKELVRRLILTGPADLAVGVVSINDALRAIEAALASSRAVALEEAAKVVKAVALNIYGPTTRAAVVDEAVAAIRALIGEKR